MSKKGKKQDVNDDEKEEVKGVMKQAYEEGLKKPRFHHGNLYYIKVASLSILLVCIVCDKFYANGLKRK